MTCLKKNTLKTDSYLFTAETDFAVDSRKWNKFSSERSSFHVFNIETLSVLPSHMPIMSIA
jgi:hypothetical protein